MHCWLSKESEQDFMDTYNLCADALICFTFSYSVRPGTLAATMEGQIPTDIKKRSNADWLSKYYMKIASRYLNKPLQFWSEIFKQENANIGHTSEYLEVKILIRI